MKTENFEKGNLYGLGITTTTTERNWNPHPKFKGVFLKHLITGSQTNNQFSSHIVKINPHCILDEHIHEGKTELHEIINGGALCYIGDKKFQYKPGDCAIIPQDTVHKVIAFDDGLMLLAKFFPALL